MVIGASEVYYARRPAAGEADLERVRSAGS